MGGPPETVDDESRVVCSYASLQAQDDDSAAVYLPERAGSVGEIPAAPQGKTNDEAFGRPRTEDGGTGLHARRAAPRYPAAAPAPRRRPMAIPGSRHVCDRARRRGR